MSSRNAVFDNVSIASALLFPVKCVVSLALTLAGLLVVAWIIDWACVRWVWEDGAAHLARILHEELQRMAIEPDFSKWHRWATSFAKALYDFVFRWTGIHDMAIHSGEAAALSVPDTIVRNAYRAHYEEVTTAMLATQLFGIRLGGLCIFVPWFALVYGVAAVDGFVMRAVRRSQSGHESATVYHRVKYLHLSLVVFCAAFCLCAPVVIDLAFVAVSAAFVLGFLTQLQWRFYKKHI